MNTSQENKLSMYEATIEVMDNNSALVGTVAALVAAKSDMVNKTLEIRAANTVQQMTTKGKTMDKADRKEELADTAYAVAGSVQAYAAENNNNDLYMLVNFSRWTLRKADDEEIQQLCQLIHDQANAVVGDLADYGVDVAKLTALQDMINAWSSQSQAPRVAISERVAATLSLPELFAEADDIIKKRMDKLMEQFYQTEKTFYDTYKAARKIVNAGHGGSSDTPANAISISGNVADNSTSSPIVGATVTLIPSDGGDPIVTTTTDDGSYEMEFTDVPPATTFSATLEATAENFEPSSTPIEVEAGNSYEFNFALTPVVGP